MAANEIDENVFNELLSLVCMYQEKELIFLHPTECRSYLLSEDPSFSSNGKTEIFPITFNLNIEEAMMLTISLSNTYPSTEPSLSLSAPDFSRAGTNKCLNDLKNFLSENYEGCVCVNECIEWLQLHSLHYRSLPSDDLPPSPSHNQSQVVREWIWFHHIYSKHKREKIMDYAHRFHLSGFSLHGKPGLVCIEGDIQDVGSFSSSVRALNWQKMSNRMTEEILETERVFSSFFELTLKSNPDFISQLEKYSLIEQFRVVLGMPEVKKKN